MSALLPRLTGFAVTLIGALVSGGGLWWWASDPATLPIRKVRIEGEFLHLTNEQLQAAVAPHVSGGFFTVDVEAVSSAAETLPWVADVQVRRMWPDTLRLRVEEQKPLARWGERELINQRGERFAPEVKSIPEGLPRFVGHAGLETQMVERFVTIGRDLEPVGLHIRELAVDGRRAWRMVLDNGVELLLGRNEVDLRLTRFVAHYGGVLAARADQVERVDMRYPNGFSVKWKTVAG